MSELSKGEADAGNDSPSGDVRVWVNGERVDPATPSISALDHGVTVGDGVFETCRVVNGAPFALRRHARRLDRSMAGLGLPPADHSVIEAGIKAVLTGLPLASGRLRYTVTGGAGPLGSDRDASALTYIVTAGAQPPNPDTGKLVVVPWTRNERGATAGLKTTSYAENVVALAFANERGGVEALFANSVGNLCECHEQLKQYDPAERWRRKWLAVVKAKDGPESIPYAAELLEHARSIAVDHGALFAELKAVPQTVPSTNGHLVIPLPCSSQDLFQALSISRTDVA